LPGTYYVNPQLFKVIPESAKEVKPGEVAVIVSNTGKDPSEDIRRQMAAKVRERMEREEKEQAEQSARLLDKLDEGRTAAEIKMELMSGDPADRRLIGVIDQACDVIAPRDPRPFPEYRDNLGTT